MTFKLRFSWVLAALFFITLQAVAQQQMLLGYCPDELTAEAEPVMLDKHNNTLFKAAIVLPQARMKLLKGAKITKFRLATDEGTRQIGVMLRHELTGNTIPDTYASLQGEQTRGWKELTLSTPYTVTGEQLVILCEGLLPAGKGLMTDGTPHPNGCWVTTNGVEWTNGADMGYKSLCMKAVVETDGETSLEDVALNALTVEQKQVKKGNKAHLSFSIGNFTSQTVQAPTVRYCLATQSTDSAMKAHTEGEIAPEGVAEFKLEMNTEACREGKNEVMVWIDSDNGLTANDTLRATLACYADSFKRKTLIELFSTMPCGNCPAAHRWVSKMVAGRTDYVWLVHHIGYKSDELTVNDSYELESPLTATATPRMAYDRRVLPCSLNDRTPIINTYNLFDSQPYFEFCVKQPAFVKIDIEPTYNEATRELQLAVRGERTTFGAEVYPDARLTVQLAEDSVETEKAQNGSGEHVQNHVYRRSLTPILGDDIQWANNRFSRSFTLTVPDAWNPKFLSVVAMVNRPVGDDSREIEILNVNNAPVLQTQSGIADNTAADERVISRTYYNLQGIQMAQPTKGIYLEKIRTTKGETTIKRMR